MNRLRFVVALALAIVGLLTSRTAGLASPMLAGEPSVAARSSPPVMGLRPAVAMEPMQAIAWTARHPDGHRVVAAVPAGEAPRAVGPVRAGNDGAPALVSTREGLLLVAARRDDNGSSLWSRRWDSGTWRPAGRMPSAGRENHHPAAASADGAWIVWVAGDSSSPAPGDPLYAARWDGRRWSDPERLPPAPGEPMAPAVALDKIGRPVVVWAAGDGDRSDAEVWVSRRSGEAVWSAPVALSDNSVPDIQPSIARTANGRLLVAWSRFTPIGYEIRASSERGGSFGPAHTLSPAPAASPDVIDGGNGEVLWSSPMPFGGSRLRSAILDGRRVSRPTDLATLYNGRFDVAVGANGSVLAAWQSPARPVSSTGSTDATGRLRLRVPSGETAVPETAPSSVPGGISLPGTWRGVGDSITVGVEVDEFLIETPVAGYTVPLGSHLSELTGRFIVVINSGISGEDSTDLLGRLAGLMIFDPKQYVFILTGANDIAVLVDSETILRNLTFMVRSVTAAGCLPILGRLTPRREAGFLGGLNAHIMQINDRLPTMTAFEGALLADTHGALLGFQDFYSDLIHPNQAGYDSLAVAWFRTLAPLLTRLLQEEDTERDLGRTRLLDPPKRPDRLGQ